MFFSKKSLSLLSVFFLIIFISIINKFPSGYTFAGGDFFHYFNYDSFFESSPYLHAWTHLKGVGYFMSTYAYNLYYFLFLPFHFLRLDVSFYSSLSYLIYLGGGFISFYLSSVLFFDDKKNIERFWFFRLSISLLYTFNPFTFNLFYSGNGFTSFMFIYVMLPAFFGVAYKFFTQKEIEKRMIFVLGLIVFISNIAFASNIAFFVVLCFFLFLFIIFIYFIYNLSIKDFFTKFFTFWVVFFVSASWQIVPQGISLFSYHGWAGRTSGVFSIDNWIISRTVKILNIFFSTESQNIFDKWFDVWPGLVFFPILFILVFLSLFFKKKLSDRKEYNFLLLFISFILLLIFFLNKGIDFWSIDTVLTIFKSNPFFLLIRSEDKLFVFLNFFVVLSLFFGYRFVVFRKNIIFYFFYFMILIIFITPFFSGRIQKSIASTIKEGEDYSTVNYSYINKIPAEYQNNFFSKKKYNADGKLLSLPYSVINSPGWVNYPKWKVVGLDPTYQFFSKPIINLNDYPTGFSGWNYGKIWNQQDEEESAWILPFSGLLNTNYIIFHKDVGDNFIENTKDKIKYYEDRGFVKLLDRNDYFDLYSINEKYYLPLFHVPEVVKVFPGHLRLRDLAKNLSVDNGNKSPVSFLFESQNENKDVSNLIRQWHKQPIVDFEFLDITKYNIKIKSASDDFLLVFSEGYNKYWKVSQSLFGSADDISEDLHFLVNGYANAWLIEPAKLCDSGKFKCEKDSNGEYNFEVFVQFWPQKVLKIFFWVSFTTFLVCFIGLFFCFFRKKSSKELII